MVTGRPYVESCLMSGVKMLEDEMNADVRLEHCQAALEKRGVRDVKFFFGALSEKPLTQLGSDVADALDAVNQGNFVDLPLIGDSVRLK